MVWPRVRQKIFKITIQNDKATWATWIVYWILRKWHFSKLHQWWWTKQELRKRRKTFFMED